MYWRHTKNLAMHLIRAHGSELEVYIKFFFSGGGGGGGGKCSDEVVLIMLSIHLKFTVLAMQTTYQSK